MSIRDELANLVDLTLNRIGSHCFVDDEGLRSLIDAILARYAVVELPDPTEIGSEDDTTRGYQAWEAGPVRVTVGDNGTFDFFATNTIGNENPDSLRRAAAALLAAANRAEAQP